MIRVLIVDESLFVRDWSNSTVARQADIEIIGTVDTLSEALAHIELCDLALVSTSLPADGAYQLVRMANRTDHCVKVLVYGTEESKPSILRYIEAGALGYICRQSNDEDLLLNIRSAYRGEALLAPDIAAALVLRLAELTAWFEEIKPAFGMASTLTRREREILLLLGRDFTNQDIANHLIIEVGTVKNHVHNILAKLNVNSRREAANYLSLVKDRPRLNRRRVSMPGPNEHYLT